MSRAHRRRIHPRGLLERLVEWLRGREQMLVRAGADMPLLLISYPPGGVAAAREIQAAYAHTWFRLSPETRAHYEGIFPLLPALVVVLLRPRNLCDCLGHRHPRGAESRLTKRLASDLGSSVAEIDLAYEAIRRWQPQPLSSLAVGAMEPRLAELHFQAAVLAVLFHELEHLAIPASAEHETRAHSDRFYARAMEELVAAESGAAYGMASPPPRP